MICFLNKKPPGLTQIDHHECDLWIEGKDDIGAYAYAGLILVGKECVFHLEVTRFSGVILTDLKKDFEDIKGYLRSRRIEHVIASNWTDDTSRWTKFIAYFGFEPPERHFIKEMNRHCLASKLRIGGK